MPRESFADQCCLCTLRKDPRYLPATSPVDHRRTPSLRPARMRAERPQEAHKANRFVDDLDDCSRFHRRRHSRARAAAASCANGGETTRIPSDGQASSTRGGAWRVPQAAGSSLHTRRNTPRSASLPPKRTGDPAFLYMPATALNRLLENSRFLRSGVQTSSVRHADSSRRCQDYRWIDELFRWENDFERHRPMQKY